MFFISFAESYNETENPINAEYLSHCIGYYTSLEEAQEAIGKFKFEPKMHIYPFAVIEQISPGIHVKAQQQIWFGWHLDLECYKEIPKPEQIATANNFSIG